MTFFISNYLKFYYSCRKLTEETMKFIFNMLFVKPTFCCYVLGLTLVKDPSQPLVFSSSVYPSISHLVFSHIPNHFPPQFPPNFSEGPKSVLTLALLGTEAQLGQLRNPPPN